MVLDPERLATLLAIEGLLVRVDPLMNLQVGIPGKFLPACLAFKPPLLSVCPLVANQTGLLPKSLLTHAALKRLEFRVSTLGDHTPYTPQ